MGQVGFRHDFYGIVVRMFCLDIDLELERRGENGRGGLSIDMEEELVVGGRNSCLVGGGRSELGGGRWYLLAATLRLRQSSGGLETGVENDGGVLGAAGWESEPGGGVVESARPP
ncbi:hypothetical protein GLAREA_02789 [Glarea lozoyensis ATCC 20868]|uniref:Uncharacterized protein n=1 Tax=Glarea lozoyensis (strain ATCC 20868 / MF5171) TaxID=1116229 RepID=S3CME0_GLAL2|nr:uncharacterized protein GLAREA_02789 [Glarea lozoyensis ATCC 20868]EPE26875.1 hypothetical protein GLAREA_02789 [Glarea lozoyensis ATCC 20868]